MAEQILPLTGLDQAGVNFDTPRAALPPQVFSGARNVRFRDGSVNKMEGEVNIFPDIFANDSDAADIILKYVAWWPNPNRVAEYSGYYLLIAQRFDSETNLQMDFAYIIEPDGEPVLKGKFQPDDLGNWQHTFFQGGFCLIINNGQDVPHYILDNEGNTDINEVPDFAELPGWQSYNVNIELLDDTFTSTNTRVFDLGQTVDFEVDEIVVERTRNDVMTTLVSSQAQDTDFVPGNLPDSDAMPDTGYAIYTDTDTATTVIVFSDDSDTGVVIGDTVGLRIRSRETVAVRCGVIRAFGDFLVAANLREVAENDLDVVVRNLPGIVRTSDQAAPGSIPNNWNPFAIGTNTAAEFVVTQAGIVQDMAELQGSLYIYSNNSISIMRVTGNPLAPLTVNSVTDAYGVQTTNGVIQFDGQHFVVGSQDIYVFGGHPGNIQSVADGRVRNYFYDRLNPLHEQRMFLLRHRQKDEIWICYPSTSSITGELDRALIWNYRKNVWTERDLYNVIAGDLGPVPGGGVPSVLIDLDGVSGDNGVTNIGAIEVQSLSIDPNLRLTGDTDGHVSTYTITVSPDIAEYNTTGGLPIHDIILDPTFNTGSDEPFLFIAEGRDADDDLTYNFEIQLPPNVTTKAALIAALEADSEFNTHMDIEDLADSEYEFVIDVLTEGTVTSSLSFGVRQLWTQDTLTADPANNISNPQTQVEYDTDGYTKVLSSVFVPADAVGHYFFLDFPGAGDFPPGTIWRIVPGVGSATDEYMYGHDNFGDDMYGTLARGGTPLRPIKAGTNPPSQFMYRYRTNDDDTSQISEPWIPTEEGTYEIEILVPDGDFVWTDMDWQLLAYDAPQLSHDGTIGPGTTLGADLTRRHFPNISDSDIANAPPIVNIRNGEYIYNIMADTDVENTVLTSIEAIAIGGEFIGVPNHEHDISDHISEQLHDSATSYFDSVNAQNVATLTSRRVGKHFVVIDSIGGNPQGVTVDDFTVAEVNRGQFPLRQELDGTEADNVLEIVYPQIRLQLAADNGMNYDELITIENQNTNLFADITARQIIEQVIQQRFDDTDVDGWSSTVLPDEYVQPTADTYRFISSTARTDGNPNRREVTGTWVATIARYGNAHVGAAQSWDPNFVWSRDTDTMNGFTVNSSNDFRGAFFLRSTPSYFGVLIYNTEATNNLETLVLEAGTAGDYNIDAQTGTNGTTLTAEQCAEKWISELRIANRRLNVLDRGTEGQFLIQPANYDDTANFILEVAFNDTAAGAARVQEFAAGSILYRGEQTETTVNRRSANIFFNQFGTGIFDPTLNVASNAPTAVVDATDSQINPSDTRRPDRTTRETDATLENVNEIDIRDGLFDVDRPWPRGEVNFNLFFPIFAQNTVMTDDEGNEVNINKVAGADIGWARPTFSTEPRVEIIDGTDLTITGNDAPVSYLSFALRQDLPLSPEFEIETLGSVALWADGSYNPGFFGEDRYARLLVRTYGTDQTGDNADYLRYIDGGAINENGFYISEDYKSDIRTTGRFLNIQIEDRFRDTDEEVIEGKTFSPQTQWRLSGIQLGIMRGGRR